ncbi:uncharacterized protein A1O5_10866 [Cladophialophora psammophila CBS 110553]|uniref:Major facilitator superfamily (MFS) profile domain-containing protein n=1 Tax=Cladophialophora psammophila CBS 110553 TaxID=1182543 RepID=W9WLN5_9EURO|nr:uncharacterized protein A1O5_10866 [Cladophialophora psammophila CBS 110553]EXJ65890.1 hypothetical protein A1O5_10866 [Cladophialophora psammophila CBS 110553]
MDRFGRRPLLLLGSVIMTISHIINAVLVGLYFDSWNDHKDKGWMVVAFLFLFLRGKGVAWSTCSNWLNNFIIGLITPPLIQNTRRFGAYTFFAVFCTLNWIWTWFCVPETKGRSLEDMDRVFGDRAAVADKVRRKEILKELKQNDGRMKQEEAKTV